MAAFLGLFLFSCEKDVPMTQEEAVMAEMAVDLRCEAEPCITTLFAGQDIDVGTVTVQIGSPNTLVTYDTKDGWFITEVHLYVGDGPPRKPAPGRFPYKEEGLNTQEYTFSIPMDISVGECVTIAAHAVVRKAIGYEPPSLSDFAAALPDQVSMAVQHPGGDSYFNVTISGGTSLDGTFDDWCVDQDHTITPGATYTAKVYSSYETLEDGLLEYPENLPKVNYIINTYYAGMPYTGTDCTGNYTYGDIQLAIWKLVDDGGSTSGLGAYSTCRVNEILADANANGAGYTPPCGGFIAVILQPVNGQQLTIAQVTAAVVDVPCTPIYQEETAWGFGPYQFDKGWGWYFECCYEDTQAP